ncbi:hydrolase [uncultured Ferrovibrio sp.]|jgi:nicotinamidase-related amidase|uniref:hydrolase n=1 Tax=uncultured Ferrovibrio sp. TaxID=1576913 RepID=UPI002631BD82|nr:hydrolase [uncultured Ferrovibrio sp.]
MTLLSAPDSLLLIVDIQERLLPVMQEPERVVRNAGLLLEAAKRLGIPVLVTEQYPKGLGPTVAPVSEAAGSALVREKLHFSAWADPTISADIEGFGRRQVVIAGIEAHVCVLQTAIDLAAAGRNVYVVADATSSRRQESAELAHRRLTAAGITLVNTEMCLFEWLGTATHAEFKALSRLIK